MGRIWETRKVTMFKRWDKMSKAFTRVGREISLAIKAGGPSLDSNAALRRAVQNARAVNMPKDRVEAAIKKASGQGEAAYEEIVYEGYGPGGVAIIVTTATDNPVRTVANLRMYFSRGGGNLGSSGSVGFLFKRMGVFRIAPESLAAAGLDAEALELDLMDHGLEEMGEGTGERGEALLVVRCAFNDFGVLQRAIEERKLTPVSTAVEYVPASVIELPDEQANELLELVDRIEQDDDVQGVFHTLG